MLARTIKRLLFTTLLTAPLALAQGIDSPAVNPQGTANSAAPKQQLNSAALPTPTDASALSSPVPAGPQGTSFRVGTALQVMLTEEITSGRQQNGSPVHARLAVPVRTSTGVTLPRGTPVEATVVSASKAGVISSGGVLSLQLVRVGPVPVVTDVVDFNGQQGHKDVADSAPAKGSEAEAASGSILWFKVLEVGRVPGLVPGVAPAHPAIGGSGGNGSGDSPAQGNGTGSPSTQPGVSQRPTPSATQGVTPNTPR